MNVPRFSGLLARLRSAAKHPVGRASILRVVSLVVGVLSSVILARLGGAEVKGVASAFAAANAVGFMLVNFDLPQQLLREIRTGADPNVAWPTLVRAWVAYSVVGGVVLAIGLVAGAPLSWLILGTLAFLIGSQAGVVSTGISGIVVSAVGAIAQQLALVLATVGFATFGLLNEETVRIGVVFSYLAPMAIYVTFLVRNGGAGRGGRPQGVVRLARAGIPWQLGRFAQILLQKADTLVVFTILGAAAAGTYSVALSTAMLCTIIPAQFASKMLFDSTQRRVANIGRATRAALLTGGATAAVMAFIGEPGIMLLYGQDFAAAYPALLACLVGAVAYGVIQVQGTMIRMTGQWYDLALTSGFGLIIMVASLWLTVQSLGLVGAGLSFSLGAAGSAVAGSVSLSRIARHSR